MNLKAVLILMAAILLGGCYGRPHLGSNASELTRAAGLQAGQPSVVVFSALWCHPCREEIDTLNHAYQEFSGSIQFRGMIVEGEEKGSLVQAGDIPLFTSFTGKPAQYKMQVDPSWKVFDSIHAPQGRALPTMVVLNSALQVERVIQKSLDYETQLRPLLLALARGQKVTEEEPSKPAADFKDSVGNWVARAEVTANPSLVKNLTASWQEGLRKFSFPQHEMPFALGTISFNWDGADLNTPKTATWIADTVISYCTMDIVLNPDATAESMTGNCRQK